MKLWLATSEFSPEGVGDVGTYAARTVTAWIRAGHEVSVLLRDEALDPHRSRALRVDEPSRHLTVVRYGPQYAVDAHRRLGGAGLVSWQCAEAVAEHRQQVGSPDVLEVQDRHGLGYFTLMRQRTFDVRLRGFPVVVAVHAPKWLVDPVDEAPVYRLPGYWAGEMERAALAAADGVLLPSMYWAERLASALGDVPRLVVMPPLAGPEGAGALAPAPDGGVVVRGPLGRAAGSLELFLAMKTLWEAGCTTPLDVVGGSAWYHPQQQTMQAYLTRVYAPFVARGLVRFHDGGPGSTGGAVVRARVVVGPSLAESSPYPVLEAMARGQVVVASDAGSPRELIRSGENGILVPAGRAAALAEGIREALALSPGRRDAMGRAAQRTARGAADADRVTAVKGEWFAALATRPARARASFPFTGLVGPVPRCLPRPAGAPRLSVIVPHYNLGDYVEQAVQSVLASTVVPDEVLVVDDDSRDPASVARLYRLAARYPAVAVVRVAHGGPAPTRNAGTRLARGQFVAFVDADDQVDRRYFERALAILTAYDNVSMVCSWVQGFGAREEVWPTWTTGSPYALFQNMFSYSSMVVRRDALLAHGLGDPAFVHGMEDWEVGVGLLLAGHGGVAVPEPLYHYRLRAGSRSRGANPARMLDQYRRIVAKHREGLTPHLGVLAGLLNANGPQYGVNHPTEPTFWVRQEGGESQGSPG